MKKLSNMFPGESGVVIKLGKPGKLRRKIIDMGITPGTKITVLSAAPLGDPIKINIRGYELSIRKSECHEILTIYTS
jgi:ferrous iron transport protein A